MARRDRQLGMHADITRRDFIHGAGLAALGLALPGAGRASSAPDSQHTYPPTLTGLRGAHPGSFEVAHALAREGRDFGPSPAPQEAYDLVVVGGGISGLAAAYFYRQRVGPDARILVLDNHDDFGGHAKRNEFPQGGGMQLAWGGVFNLEYPYFSDTVNALLKELGVDVPRLLDQQDFHYGADGARGAATWFDADSFGRDVLLPGFSLRRVDYDRMAGLAGQVPLDDASVESLRRFFLMDTDVLAGRTPEQRREFQHGTSYIDFIRQSGGLTERAAELFVNTTHGYWGIGATSLSVAECEGAGLPMAHLLGGGREAEPDPSVASVAHFPDGNASVARLLVRALIPAAATGAGMDDIAVARFDYNRLDEAGSQVRLRLSATAVGVEQDASGVQVRYVRNGGQFSVRAGQCVLACNHAIIPHLCPDLPERQKRAMAYQVKRPLLLTNVLLRSAEAADQLGISGAHCPGRMHGACWLLRGISSGGYRSQWSDKGPVVMQFWGTVAPPDATAHPHVQHRASRARMLALRFEDYEREVRTVLNGMLGPAGFDAARDVLAITVNRWPHGYACDYLDLWDPEWAPGEAPHEIARRRFGHIAMANADAGADAYTHVAIDQAWRAVDELGRTQA